MAKKYIKWFLCGVTGILLLCMAMVVLFDPFYQYHKPLPGLKAVLSDKEYQCIGTLKTFEYDSVIAGSSVAENYNNRWFDEGFNCTSIKAIRSYGATADLCYLLDVAFDKQELEYVFYSMDPTALSAETQITFESTGCPMYLYDDNYFNDIKYLLNKDVLLEKIPYMLANSFLGDYDEGNSYNWAKWKTFSKEVLMSNYTPKEIVDEMKPADFAKEKLEANLALLKEQIERHPDTEFKILMPPYSIMWWDNAYRTGETESLLYNFEKAMETLIPYENVSFYFFMNERDIVTNLDNYMDAVHFSDEINHYVCNSMVEDNYRVTMDNYKEVLADMRELVYQVAEEEETEMTKQDKNTFAVPEGFDAVKEGVTYGELFEISYDSKTTGTTRKANVILPPDYDESRKYPVLYLLHGIGGDHNEWLGAEPVNVLSNLVADGDAVEMIVVIPNVRARANDAGNPSDIYTLEHYKAFDNFINDLREDLMPYIEANYPVLTGKENTAIAGLSMGGRESLFIGFSMPETFGYIGAFTPAPGLLAYTNFGVSEDGMFTKETFKLPEGSDNFVMINAGESDDIVKHFPQTYYDTLEGNGVESIFYVTEGGHDFTVWKNGLYNFAKEIFK